MVFVFGLWKFCRKIDSMRSFCVMSVGCVVGFGFLNSFFDVGRGLLRMYE